MFDKRKIARLERSVELLEQAMNREAKCRSELYGKFCELKAQLTKLDRQIQCDGLNGHDFEFQSIDEDSVFFVCSECKALESWPLDSVPLVLQELLPEGLKLPKPKGSREK